IAVIATAVAAASIAVPSGVVERFYSLQAYVFLQRPITGASNGVRFALFDVLVITVIGGWVALAIRDLMAKRRLGATRTLVRISARTLVWAAGLYLAFLLIWGLNYRRPALIDKLPFDSRSVTVEGARLLALQTVDQLNRLYG